MAVGAEHERLGEVLQPVAVRCGGVAGEREVRQTGEGEVGRAAESGLEHPTAPHGHAVDLAHVVHPLGLEVPANASGLDVDDRCRTQRDRVGRALGRHDRLVEADRGLHLLGEECVVPEVVGGQRLLDEQEPERVELSEVFGVLEHVRRVRVDLQHQVVTKTLAHSGHPFDVDAGLDLELDPDVAVVEVPGDLVEQLLGRVEDPDRHPGGHALGDRAEPMSERLTRGAQLGVEDRHLEGRLGHRVPLEHRQDRRHVLGRDVAGGEQQRSEEVFDHVGRALDVLGRVAGRGQRDALAPPGDVGAAACPGCRPLDPDQQHVAVELRAERSPERRAQRHRHTAELDPGQFHRSLRIAVTVPRLAFAPSKRRATASNASFGSKCPVVAYAST